LLIVKCESRSAFGVVGSRVLVLGAVAAHVNIRSVRLQPDSRDR